MNQITPTLFLRQFQETLEWCQSRSDLLDPENCLRSRSTRPRLSQYHSTDSGIWVCAEMIDELVQQRRLLLIERGFDYSQSQTTLKTGRLLISAYEYTNHNGLTADVTARFFDDYDVPPWDTWVGEVTGLLSPDVPGDERSTWPPTFVSFVDKTPPNRGLLVSWIPPIFIETVNEAIRNECTGMLSWGDELQKSAGGAPMFDRVLPEWLTQFSNKPH